MNKKYYYLFVSVFVVIAAVSIGYMFFGSKNTAPAEAKEKITVYKSPTCGCCSIHASYLKGKGFEVRLEDTNDMVSVKNKYNIPAALESCHTSVLENGYVVEGHMPIEAIDKLRSEKPDILGVALPEMPTGSPGMAGKKEGPFRIFSLKKDGSSELFMEI